ncbi:hypothetical protein HYPDE_34258 [Hyphomicrobium denitrificans 1NES1]|uniref:Uncharacterized protein n=1 Tax=Hyphomicrobium denitrificans 1NES1 TaxID=670307 RepID=N0B6B3_9HYPH|nr:hypothetical protein [Hyphomicrobium denitrificans]AGK58523.1 hypothetical protein HYPDE_34258 [Hyphomicrobium denitrificans 1NES1]
MAMSQIARDSMFGVSSNSGEFQPVAAQAMPTTIRLGDYLQSEIITHPLPNKLLDRLADLYWTERESKLAI